MKVIDNFLPGEEFKTIHDFLMGPCIPWFYNHYVDYKDQIFDFFDLDNYQFVHSFYSGKGIDPLPNKDEFSEYFPLLDPIGIKLNWGKLLRVKANLNPRTSDIIKRKYHVDVEEKCKTSIFYLNTNNGYTEFESGVRVSSVANRVCIFDSNLKHRGTTHTEPEPQRIVVNFNYE